MRKKSSIAADASRRRFRIRIGVGGFWFLVGSVLIGLAAIDSNINLLLILFGLCFGAILLGALWDLRGLRKIAAQRILPDVLGVEQIAEIRYVLTNLRRWGSIRNLRIVDHMPPGGPLAGALAFVAILRPGETVTVAAPVRPLRRGKIQFGQLILQTSFPFAIFTKSVARIAAAEAIVLPKLLHMKGDPELSIHHGIETGGAAGLTRASGDEEYYGVREFRAGDNPRRIHWRRSAQTGQLMVREMARTLQPQVWCVVDTLAPAKDDPRHSVVEQIISAAATFVCGALERGIKVGLICNGDPLVVLPPGAGRQNRPRLLRELALRERNTSDSLAGHIRRLSWPMRWRGPCVMLAAEKNVEVRRAASALNSAIGPTTVLVPGTSAFDDIFVAVEQLAESLPQSDRHHDQTIAPAFGNHP
jgi:uncharacterized protein (DUF58 family)